MQTVKPLDPNKPIPAELWPVLLRGQPMRYLVRDEQKEFVGKHARFCLSCGNIGKPTGDPRRAWCQLHRMMVGNTFPVLCPNYK